MEFWHYTSSEDQLLKCQDIDKTQSLHLLINRNLNFKSKVKFGTATVLSSRFYLGVEPVGTIKKHKQVSCGNVLKQKIFEIFRPDGGEN